MRVDALRGPDAGTLLIRALRGQAAEAGIGVAIRSIASTPWASATFVGTRHRIAFGVPPGDASDRWIASLPDIEWAIRGHLVADVVTDSVGAEAGETTLLMSILTIEDR